jgi:hypothetical protein
MLTFRLRRPGTIVLVVRGADCSVLGRKSVHGKRGLNRVRFNGRVHGRPLGPGEYTIDLVVVRGSASSRFGAVAVEVVTPNRRLTQAQRTQPLANDCSVAIAAPALPVALAFTGGALAAVRVDASTRAGDVTGKRQGTGVLGVNLKPPRLPLPVVDRAPLWLGVFLLVLCAVGVAWLAIYLVRFRRGFWNP